MSHLNAPYNNFDGYKNYFAFYSSLYSITKSVIPKAAPYRSEDLIEVPQLLQFICFKRICTVFFCQKIEYKITNSFDCGLNTDLKQWY